MARHLKILICTLLITGSANSAECTSGGAIAIADQQLSGRQTLIFGTPGVYASTTPKVTPGGNLGVLRIGQDVRAFDIDGKLHKDVELAYGEIKNAGRYAAKTDLGDGPKYFNAQGEDVNQDALVIFKTNDGRSIFVSLDGVGDHGGGEIASGRVAEYLVESAKSGKTIEEAIKGAPADLVKFLNEKYPKMNKDAGTTLVSMELKGNTATFSHAGDSRAVVFRGPEVAFHTIDQSPYGELMQQRVQAAMQATGSDSNASRTQALRQFEESHEFFYEYKNMINGGVMGNAGVSPTRHTMDLQKDDWVVLASDGMWDNLRMHEVNAILATTATPEEATARLRALVRNRVQSGDGKLDNVNIIVYKH